MFSNVLMTTLTPLSNTDENTSWQNRPFTSIWPEDLQQYLRPSDTTRAVEQPKNAESRKTIKKKKRVRTAFSTIQIQILEDTFYRQRYIDTQTRRQLALSLNLSERSIKIWFQNRRMKQKRESSESSDSCTETMNSEDTSPRSLSDVPSPQEIGIVYAVSEEKGDQQYCNPLSEEGNYQPYGNSLSYYNYDWSGKHFCNISESQSPAPPVAPPVEAFTNDGSIYPTSYYPTLVDYFLGENQENEVTNENGSEMQWSATNFDLSNLQ